MRDRGGGAVRGAGERLTPPRAAGLTVAFLDRDGTINRKPPAGDYVRSPAEMELLPRAADAVRLLHEFGLRVVVVTNQRGIARGLMSERDLAAVHERMLDELAAAGARVDAVYHCPHDVGECDCRKPATGMLRAAVRDVPGIDPHRAVVIGDSLSDMEAARRFGAMRILVADAAPAAADEDLDAVVPSLWDAAQVLVRPGPD